MWESTVQVFACQYEQSCTVLAGAGRVHQVRIDRAEERTCSPVAHTWSCMYAPPFWHRGRDTLQCGAIGKQCCRHQTKQHGERRLCRVTCGKAPPFRGPGLPHVFEEGFAFPCRQTIATSAKPFSPRGCNSGRGPPVLGSAARPREKAADPKTGGPRYQVLSPGSAGGAELKAES